MNSSLKIYDYCQPALLPVIIIDKLIRQLSRLRLWAAKGDNTRYYAEYQRVN